MARSWTRLAGAALLLVTAVALQAAPPRSDAFRPTFTHVRKPLLFEANRGQAAARSDFIAYGPDYTVTLAAGRVTLSSAGGVVVRLTFVGSNASDPRPLDRQTAQVQYDVGGSGSRWIANIPVFGRVVYPDTYPGVDVVYYGHHGELEFDLELAGGVSPSAVRIAIDGAAGVRVDMEGALRILVRGDEIRIDPPIVHQAGDESEIPVSASYVLESADECSIAIAPPDSSRRTSAEP